MEEFFDGKMVSFPACDLPQMQESVKIIADEDVLHTAKVPVYCKCRMPCYGKEMMAQCTQCNEWFHQKCDNIPNSVFKRKNRTPFICISCS